MTDREIILLQRSGECRKAFNAIVGCYSERLYWHIRRLTGSHDDTDDLLQEVYMKIWNGLRAFKGESRIYTWIYRIATNETLTFISRSSHCDAVEDIEAYASQLEADEWFDGDRLQARFTAAIQALPPKQRLVFNMKYYDDMK